MAGNSILGYFMGKEDIEVETHGQSGPGTTRDPRQKAPNIVSTDSAKESLSWFLQEGRGCCVPQIHIHLLSTGHSQ